MRIKLIQSNQSEMVSYFHENLNKRIGAIAQTVYMDVYNCLRCRLTYNCWPISFTSICCTSCKLDHSSSQIMYEQDGTREVEVHLLYVRCFSQFKSNYYQTCMAKLRLSLAIYKACKGHSAVFWTQESEKETLSFMKNIYMVLLFSRCSVWKQQP